MLHSRESSIREIIRHICINQERFTFIFSSLLEESDYVNLLKSLCQSSPPKIFTTTKIYPNEVYFQYSANILLSKENIEEGIDLQSFYVYELKKLGKLWSGELFQALTSNTSQFPLTRLYFNLSFLLKKKMPLFRSIKSLFWELLHKFQNSDLVKTFGMTIFEMDDQIDIDILSSYDIIKNVTNQNISTFLQIPAVLTTEKSSKLIQSLLSCSEPFPGYSKLFKEPNILTLINDSIVKRSHFIENILKVGLSYNCNLSKLISLTESCCCSEFLPFYFILSDGQINDQPIEELSKLDDSHAFHIFKRFYGDRKITDFFRINLGKIVPIEKLFDESLVYLLKPVLFENIDIDSIINLSNQFFYTISDKDRDIDFDFYFGFRVICLILNNNYIYKNKEKNNDYFNNYHRIREIKLLISRIKSKKMIIEIFSALFTKNRQTNKFVCPFDVAEAIITYIATSFSSSQQQNENNKNERNVSLNSNKNESNVSLNSNKNESNVSLNSNKNESNSLLNSGANESYNSLNDSFSIDRIESSSSMNDGLCDCVRHFESENEYDRVCADVFARALIHLKLGKLLISTKIRRKKNTELISSSSAGKIDSGSIEPCLMTPADIISQLLTRGEFDKASDAASDISSKLPHLGAICEVARAVQMTKRFSYSPILTSESRDIFNIEYCMSTNVDSDYVIEHCIESNEDELNCELKKIINKRKGKSLIEMFSVIQKVPTFSITSQILNDGKLNLENIGDVYDSVLEESGKTVEAGCHLTNFLNFVKKFDDHFEIFEVEELIDYAIEKVDSWEEIERIFGSNCLDGILPIIGNLKNKEKFINLVDQKSHIISTSLCSILSIPLESSENHSNRILNNLYLENTNQMEFKYPDLLKSNKEVKAAKNTFDIIYLNGEEDNESSKKIKFNKENIFNIKIDNDRIEELNFVRSSIQSILSNNVDSQAEKISQLIDFRLMNDDLLIFRCINVIMDKISFHDFLDIFPEFRTIEFEGIKSARSTPDVVLDELIQDEKVTTAIDFSGTFNAKELLIEKLVEKVEELKKINEKEVTVFVNLWNEVSSEIFERLPKKSYMNINSQIELLRNENTPVNEEHPELPVLEQYPYLNFDNDLLSIFDEKISRTVEESNFCRDFFSQNEEDLHFYDEDSRSFYFYHFTSLARNDVFKVIDEYANLYLPHFKHLNTIVQKLGNVLFNIVNTIIVRSNLGEIIAIKILEKILYLLRSIKYSLIKILSNSVNSSGVSPSAGSASLRRGSFTSSSEVEVVPMLSFPFEREIKLIECLHQFSELTVYNHFNIEYTFSNFQNSDSKSQPFPSEFFILVCDQLDFTDLLQKFASLWEFDITELQITRIENCYELGQFSKATQLLKTLGQTVSTRYGSLSAEQKERLRKRLEKAVFFDVGDAILHKKMEKIKNCNIEEDVCIEIEVEDYLCIKNNYKRINNLMKTVRSSNHKDEFGHNRNFSLNNISNFGGGRDVPYSLRNSRSIDSIPSDRELLRKKGKVNLLSNENVIRFDDIIQISKLKYGNSKDDYPFFDETVLNEFTSNFYCPSEKIWINSIAGNFSESFRIFYTDLSRSQRVAQVVLIQIFFSALNSFKYDDLFVYLNNVKYIKKTDNDNFYNFNKLLFTDVSNSLKKMKMYVVLCDFLERLYQFEGIITIIIDIINDDESWEELLQHLNILVDTIQKELSKRSAETINNEDDLSNVARKNNDCIYSDIELTLLFSKVGVLNNFTRLCIDHKISYPSKEGPNIHSNDKNQNLFKIKNLSILKIKNDHASYASLLAAIEEMAVISLYFEKFNLAFQIIDLARSCNPKKMSLNQHEQRGSFMSIEDSNSDSFVIDESSFILFKVCDNLVDKLNVTHHPLSQYFEKMYQRLDTNSYAILSLALSKVIFGKAISSRDVPIFIEANVHGMKLQANILIELGLLNDAFRIAIKANDVGLIKKLEKQASVYGNASVRSGCHRFLELKV